MSILHVAKQQADLLDIQGIVKKCLDYERKKVMRDLSLYERYFYSGLTQEDFTKENDLSRQTIDVIRRRYRLPSPPATAKQVSRLAKRTAKRQDILCDNANCKVCAYLARVWRVERKVL
jgi:hypothetical protein